MFLVVVEQGEETAEEVEGLEVSDVDFGVVYVDEVLCEGIIT